MSTLTPFEDNLINPPTPKRAFSARDIKDSAFAEQTLTPSREEGKSILEEGDITSPFMGANGSSRHFPSPLEGEGRVGGSSIKTLVVKYGGSLLESTQQTILEDIVSITQTSSSGVIFPVIVHGGGPEINRLLQALGKQSGFNRGLRVTDSDTMEITEMVLSGLINKRIVTRLQQMGAQVLGLSGKDMGLLTARKKMFTGSDGHAVDLGWVGEIETVQTGFLATLFQQSIIPVISPVAPDSCGNTYNVNADEAAFAIANAMAAEMLVFLTDTPGLLRNVAEPGSRISTLTLTEAEEWITEGIISGGMLPKVQSAMAAFQAGVHRVLFLNGRMSHALQSAVLDGKICGTELIGEK